MWAKSLLIMKKDSSRDGIGFNNLNSSPAKSKSYISFRVSTIAHDIRKGQPMGNIPHFYMFVLW